MLGTTLSAVHQSGVAWKRSSRAACGGAAAARMQRPARPARAPGPAPGSAASQRQRQPTRCRAVDQQLFSKFSSQAYLDKAAQRFRVGLENGLGEDELIAIELGAPSLEELTEVQRAYVDKLKDRLMQRAEELRTEEAARRAREARWFEAGKALYEAGEYPDSVAAFERAVEEAGRSSTVGGDSLMWLALAYQAVGREQDCIDTYKWLEANHPLPKMRKQAENLRYIMEAPRLEISPEERVQIPLLNHEDSWRRDARKSGLRQRSGGGKSSGGDSYWDRVDWSMKVPFVPDKWYYRVLLVSLLVGSAVYLNYLARG